jgi:type I restriction enzyme R subunit
MAETIENNVRRLIIDEMAVNPKYYENMSELLDALIEQRRKAALDYKDYLARIVELTRNVSQPETQSYPATINSPARRALFDNLMDVPDLEELLQQHAQVADTAADVFESAALAVDDSIRSVKKAGWRGNRFKEREVRIAIKKVLHEDALVEQIFNIAKAQRDY